MNIYCVIIQWTVKFPFGNLCNWKEISKTKCMISGVMAVSVTVLLKHITYYPAGTTMTFLKDWCLFLSNCCAPPAAHWSFGTKDWKGLPFLFSLFSYFTTLHPLPLCPKHPLKKGHFLSCRVTSSTFFRFNVATPLSIDALDDIYLVCIS